MFAYLKVLGVLVLIFCGAFALAEDYEVSVTREDSDLYKLTSEDIIIVTQYCYEYVYFKDALLSMSGQSGEIFFDENSSCRVQGAYGANDLDAGNYSVQVSRESANWYSIYGTDLYIQTRLCLELALADDSVLQIGGMGMGVGTLLFSNGDTCDVQKVYGLLNL